MKPHPCRYAATASARALGSVVISAPTLPSIETAPPPELDGPAGAWSPETLLCAAVADCFVLTFRGITRAAHFNWISLDCRIEGVLEHTGDRTQFTRFETAVRLTLPPGADHGKARQLLGQAEHACLVANSLRGERTLVTEIVAIDRQNDPPIGREKSGREGIGHRASRRELHTDIQLP